MKNDTTDVTMSDNYERVYVNSGSDASHTSFMDMRPRNIAATVRYLP